MSSAPPQPAPAAPSNERRMFVGFSIAVVTLMFISMVGLLFYKGAKQPIPQAILIVKGNENYEGATVTVSGELREPISRRMSGGEEYLCKFSLPPGNYSVRLSRGGAEREVRMIELEQYHQVTLTLASDDLLPATRTGSR